MSYLVLARKYRPTSFEDVTGQEHVTRTLAHAIERDQVAHAYLFAGPRGVGKTSIARIFAKALNSAGDGALQIDPESTISQEIDQGISLAVREIDGASHNSVDNVRELIESFRALPPPGYRYKVYIIDEVHMLSMAAFNALLKSLEEPPPNTVFILATTEAHKLPDTVISRCQRHDFRALTVQEITQRLEQVCEREKIEVESEALRMLARLSDGSMRDSQSLLERVRAFSDDKILASDVSLALGAVEGRVLVELSGAVFSRSSEVILQKIQQAFSTGLDASIFLKEFVRHWRELLLAKFSGKEMLLELGVPEDEAQELCDLVADQDRLDLQDLVTLAREGADNALRSSHPQYALESLLVQMSTRVPVKDMGEIVGKLRKVVKVVPREHVMHSAKHEVAAEEQAPPQARESQNHDQVGWEGFVNHCSAKASPLLLEQLKRMSVQKFAAGELCLRGPEFSVDYMSVAERMGALKALLQEYSGQESWNVQLRTSEVKGTADEGSLVHKSAEQKRQQKESERQALEGHPSMQELRKVFPGSKIESVRSKE